MGRDLAEKLKFRKKETKQADKIFSRSLIWVYARWEEKSGLGFGFSRHWHLSLLFLVIMDMDECLDLNIFISGPRSRTDYSVHKCQSPLKCFFELNMDCMLITQHSEVETEKEEFKASLGYKGRSSVSSGTMWEHPQQNNAKFLRALYPELKLAWAVRYGKVTKGFEGQRRHIWSRGGQRQEVHGIEPVLRRIPLCCSSTVHLGSVISAPCIPGSHL